MAVLEAMAGEVAKAVAASLSSVGISGVGRLIQLVRHKAATHSVTLPDDPADVAALLLAWGEDDPEWLDRVAAELAGRQRSEVNTVAPPPSPFWDRAAERALVPENGIVVFAGHRGCGKSALVSWLAAERASRFPVDRCFVDLDVFRDGDVPRIAEAKRHVLRQLGVTDIAAAEPELSAQYLSVPMHRYLVLVLENVLGAEEVRALAPGWPKSLTLATTRRLTDDLRGRYPCHEIGGLDLPSAREMLAGKLPAPAILAAEPERTDELLERFGRLPFAIEQLAALLIRKAGAPGAVSAVLARFADTGITNTSELISRVLADTVGELSGTTLTTYLELATHPRGEFTVESADALLGRSSERGIDELRDVGLVRPLWLGRYRMDWFAIRYAEELRARRGLDTEAAFDRVLTFYANRAVAADLAGGERLRRYTAHAVPPWPADRDRIDWLDAEGEVLAELADLAAERHRYERVGQLTAGLEVLMLHRGRYELCLQGFEAGVTAARKLGQQALLGRQHALCARAYTLLHLFDRARAELDAAWRTINSLDDPQLESSTWEFTGRLAEERADYLPVRDYPAAIDAFARAVAIDRRTGDDRAFSLHARMGANALVKQGRADEAVPLLEEAAVRTTDDRNGSRVCLVRAKAYIALDRFAEARHEIERSRALAGSANARGYENELAEVEATLAERTGDVAAARSWWGRLVQDCYDNGHPKAQVYLARLSALPK